MGLSISKLLSELFGRREMRILMVGLVCLCSSSMSILTTLCISSAEICQIPGSGIDDYIKLITISRNRMLLVKQLSFTSWSSEKSSPLFLQLVRLVLLQSLQLDVSSCCIIYVLASALEVWLVMLHCKYKTIWFTTLWHIQVSRMNLWIYSNWGILMVDLFRLQRRDRRVQEHLLHRVGCRWTGQNSSSMAPLLPEHSGNYFRGWLQWQRACQWG